jgi:dihydrofolate synthase/folylpolyglutamate synthase
VEILILTRPSNSRAITADEILNLTSLTFENAKIIKTDTVSEAIEKAVAISPPDGVIVVTGSLYLVGEVKKVLNN